MLVAQRVNDYITSKRPEGLCDSCIMNDLGLLAHAHAAQITAALGTTGDFTRAKATCASCNESRMVIHA